MSARIDHVALYVRDLERSLAFYTHWFGVTTGPRYDSTNQPGFSSYFLSFPDSDVRIELMSHPDATASINTPTSGDARSLGYAHIAIGLDTRDELQTKLAVMRAAGIRIHSAPRLTGDGYYEAVIEDPDTNTIELTAP